MLTNLIIKVVFIVLISVNYFSFPKNFACELFPFVYLPLFIKISQLVSVRYKTNYRN